MNHFEEWVRDRPIPTTINEMTSAMREAFEAGQQRPIDHELDDMLKAADVIEKATQDAVINRDKGTTAPSAVELAKLLKEVEQTNMMGTAEEYMDALNETIWALLITLKAERNN